MAGQEFTRQPPLEKDQTLVFASNVQHPVFEKALLLLGRQEGRPGS